MECWRETGKRIIARLKVTAIQSLQMPDERSLETLEAVYYPAQVPSSLEALTLLGFLFDRVYFPGVYLPPPGSLDLKELDKEIQRILAFKFSDIETIELLNCMMLAGKIEHISDFCIFDGKPGGIPTIDPLAPQVANALEQMIFGPPPENFIPIQSGNFVKGLPGGDQMISQVAFPGWSQYPANALIYATKNQLPLINDNPELPVPGIPGNPKNNAKILATILTIESVKLVLPKLRPLTPEELRDFRLDTAEFVKPFRLAMLRMAKDLNAAITSEMTLQGVQKHARFLVETSVYPELVELERVVHDPGKPWYRRAVDLARSAPEIITSFSAMPKNMALAILLGRIAGVLADARDEQLDKERKLGRTGLHFLLKLKQQ